MSEALSSEQKASVADIVNAMVGYARLHKEVETSFKLNKEDYGLEPAVMEAFAKIGVTCKLTRRTIKFVHVDESMLPPKVKVEQIENKGEEE